MSDELIRAELFSAERLEQHAQSLAAAQPVVEPQSSEGGGSLARRLRDNSRLLVDAHQMLGRSAARGQPMTPAAEWLVDNYHVIHAQVRQIRDDLPPGYYRQLPKLAAGPFAGFPRVLGIAWAFVAHTDSRFDPKLLCQFVRAYQRVQPLTIGELWASAITLRIVLVENLARAAKFIVENRAARDRADMIADEILGINVPEPVPMPAVLQEIPQGPLHPTFAVQLVQRLRDQDPQVTPALQWLDRRLAAQGDTGDAIVAAEHQIQAAVSVTVRNVVTSLRMISAVDWAELFEDVSLVDELLREDSDFSSMDFATRNRYRTAIEELARGSGLSELHVARDVLQMRAARVAENTAPTDPGHWLIGAGRAELEAMLGYRAPLSKRLQRASLALGLGGYLGAIALLTVLIIALPVWALAACGLGATALFGFALLALLPGADAAVVLVNRLIAAGLPPHPPPGMALRDGIPPAARTMVVVPTLLASVASIAAQVEHLEIHHLANPDEQVVFALLTDWTDASAETMPDDAELLAIAAEGIARLNRLYPPAGDSARFLLLHRRRLWNPAQRQWMGWERKRGKLHELNQLLRGATDTGFLPIDGAPATVPAGIRYVVTLNSDTRLPREVVRRLVGKMTHPLNRPVFDPGLGRVVSGYGLLQPRVTPSLPLGTEASLYQYAFSSAGGIDPYAAAASDVYQDLFGEGSYAGKGIYDVDVFEQALAGRVPENTLLSHDLFEGIFARAGLASDIEVIEEFPPRYDVAAARQHRWTRGDWQLLPWILGRAGRGNSAGRALEAARQSSPQPHAAGAAAGTVRRLAAAEHSRDAAMDRLRAADDRAAADRRGAARHRPSPRTDGARQPFPGGARRPAACRDPGGAGGDAAGGSGLADARRDRAHAGPALDHPPQPARMDELRPGAGTQHRRRARPLRADARHAGRGGDHGRAAVRRGAGGVGCRRAVRAAVARRARDRVVDQPQRCQR